MKKVSVFLIAGILFFAAHAASAYTQILIDEIMYDAPGADTGHEWVEVYNSGDSSINFTQWKFFEGDTDQKNHGIKSYKGNDVLAAGAYAVIATNGDKFMTDHPQYAGAIFTSSFSLSNNGETIGLKDASAHVVHQVAYTKDVGAAGDGNTLQKIDATWHVAAPTPDKANTAADVQAVVSPTTAAHDPKGEIHIDGDLSVGATLVFTSSSVPVSAGKRIWNFGDGTTLADQTKVEHAYSFPGTYTVVLIDEQEHVIAETSAAIVDTPALKEEVDAPVKETSVTATEVIHANDSTSADPVASSVSPVVIPLRATAAESRIQLSDWLVGVAALVVIGVMAFRTFKKPKTDIVIPDDGIALID